MRITTGLYRGRVIRTVKDLSVRPATDRVRQTVFNMLANRLELEGARVLDLFAGSGSLGFEALSRGAARAVFVENDAEAVRFLEENLRLLGCEKAAEIWEMDALQYLRAAKERFDLVFADPPYAYAQTADIPALLMEAGCLDSRGYLVVEHTSDLHFDTTALYRAGPEKRFGRTVVTFLQRNGTA